MHTLSWIARNDARWVRSSKAIAAKNSQDVIFATRAGVNASLLSFIEDGKKVRFKTFRAICQHGLQLPKADWDLAKLLWLEQQSGEPITHGGGSAQRLNLLHQRGNATLHRQIEACLDKHKTLISERQLQSSIVTVLGDHRLLRALPDYIRVFHSIHDPEPAPKIRPTTPTSKR